MLNELIFEIAESTSFTILVKNEQKVIHNIMGIWPKCGLVSRKNLSELGNSVGFDNKEGS